MSDAALAYLQQHHDRSLDELCELLRIPSVSSDPDRGADVRRCAEWLIEQASAIGLEHARADRDSWTTTGLR